MVLGSRLAISSQTGVPGATENECPQLKVKRSEIYRKYCKDIGKSNPNSRLNEAILAGFNWLIPCVCNNAMTGSPGINLDKTKVIVSTPKRTGIIENSLFIIYFNRLIKPLYLLSLLKFLIIDVNYFS
jgi:hypothetical protein